jgi:hypothetical protein
LRKRGYSKKVKALGAGIIILEVATVILFLVALYSNALTLASVFRSVQSVQTAVSNGNGLGITGTGQEQAFDLPNVSNDGFLPVTMSLNVIFQKNGVSVGSLSKSVTIDPHTSRDFSIPLGTIANAANGASSVNVHFEISSIYGLVGGGATATLSRS